MTVRPMSPCPLIHGGSGGAIGIKLLATQKSTIDCAHNHLHLLAEDTEAYLLSQTLQALQVVRLGKL